MDVGAAGGSAGAPPRKSGKRRLKRVLRRPLKPDLNVSRSQIIKALGLNTSANRSMLHKSTLRANNKALAQALENAKQEIRVVNESLMEKSRENQGLLVKLNNLERVAGLQNDDIEAEVQMRFDVRMLENRALLGKVSSQLLDAVQLLGRAVDATNARNSSIGSRPASVGSRPASMVASSEEDTSPNGAAQIPPPRSIFVAPANLLNKATATIPKKLAPGYDTCMGPFGAPLPLVQPVIMNHNLSLIAENGQAMESDMEDEEETVADALMETSGGDESISKGGDKSSMDGSSLVPLRVPRYDRKSLEIVAVGELQTDKKKRSKEVKKSREDKPSKNSEGDEEKKSEDDKASKKPGEQIKPVMKLSENGKTAKKPNKEKAAQKPVEDKRPKKSSAVLERKDAKGQKSMNTSSAATNANATKSNLPIKKDVQIAETQKDVQVQDKARRGTWEEQDSSTESQKVPPPSGKTSDKFELPSVSRRGTFVLPNPMDAKKDEPQEKTDTESDLEPNNCTKLVNEGKPANKRQPYFVTSPVQAKKKHASASKRETYFLPKSSIATVTTGDVGEDEDATIILDKAKYMEAVSTMNKRTMFVVPRATQGIPHNEEDEDATIIVSQHMTNAVTSTSTDKRTIPDASSRDQPVEPDDDATIIIDRNLIPGIVRKPTATGIRNVFGMDVSDEKLIQDEDDGLLVDSSLTSSSSAEGGRQRVDKSIEDGASKLPDTDQQLPGTSFPSNHGYMEEEDATTYFNTDMDFTEVINVPVLLYTASHENTALGIQGNQYPETVEPANTISSVDDGTKSTGKDGSLGEKTKSNSAGDLAFSSEDSCRERDNQRVKSGGLKDAEKSESTRSQCQVEVRVGKLGNVIFAAGRKDADGVRQAVPAKLPTKARSKQKKPTAATSKNAGKGKQKPPSTMPPSIFDYHDRTPLVTKERPAPQHGAQKSVFEMSMNESTVQSKPACTFSEFRKKVSDYNKSDVDQDSNDPATGTDTDPAFNEVAKKPEARSQPHSKVRKDKAKKIFSVGSSEPQKDDSSEIDDRPPKKSRTKTKSKAKTVEEPAKETIYAKRKERKEVDGSSAEGGSEKEERQQPKKSRTKTKTKPAVKPVRESIQVTNHAKRKGSDHDDREDDAGDVQMITDDDFIPSSQKETVQPAKKKTKRRSSMRLVAGLKSCLRQTVVVEVHANEEVDRTRTLSGRQSTSLQAVSDSEDDSPVKVVKPSKAKKRVTMLVVSSSESNMEQDDNLTVLKARSGAVESSSQSRSCGSSTAKAENTAIIQETPQQVKKPKRPGLRMSTDTEINTNYSRSTTDHHSNEDEMEVEEANKENVEAFRMPAPPDPKTHGKRTSSELVAEFDQMNVFGGGCEEGKRRRRGASNVCYTEPKLGSKLRQGDKHTSTVYEGQEHHVNAEKKGNEPLIMYQLVAAYLMEAARSSTMVRRVSAHVKNDRSQSRGSKKQSVSVNH